MLLKEEKKKILLAGPWYGEFGWELMRWQGHLRYLTNSGKYDKTFVSIPKGHEPIYKDFANHFLYNETFTHTNGWMCKEKKAIFEDKKIKEIQKNYPDHELVIYNPTKDTTRGDIKQTFIKYGRKGAKPHIDILMHARYTNKCKSHRRNWPEQKWRDLVGIINRHGLTCACIGSVNGCKYIKGANNLIGIGLEDLMDYMANASLAIGPSSGPLHLASLCGCPQMIWTNSKIWGSIGATNRYRWEIAWNPFNTKTYVLDQCNWQPQLPEVVNELRNIFHVIV